jgi:hypothetical protein
MERQAISYEVAPETDAGLFDDESLDVYCWRMEQLLDAGYGHVLADALAVDTTVDLHVACALVARGCPVETAFLILS